MYNNIIPVRQTVDPLAAIEVVYPSTFAEMTAVIRTAVRVGGKVFDLSTVDARRRIIAFKLEPR